MVLPSSLHSWKLGGCFTRIFFSPMFLSKQCPVSALSSFFIVYICVSSSITWMWEISCFFFFLMKENTQNITISTFSPLAIQFVCILVLFLFVWFWLFSSCCAQTYRGGFSCGAWTLGLVGFSSCGTWAQ